MNKLDASWRPVILVLGAAALFGTTGTALANGPDGIDPISAGVIRLLIGGLGLVLLSRTFLRTLWPNRAVVAMGALAVGSYQLGFFYSTRHAGVAIATVVTIGSSPLFARVAGAIRGRRAPGHLWNLAAIILISGLVLLTLSDRAGGNVEASGIVAALLAGASYAAYTESASLLIDRELNSTAVMGGLFFAAGLLTSPFLLFRPVAWITDQRGIVIMLYLGLATLTLAYVAFGRALTNLVPTTVVMLTLLEPVVATLLGFLVLHETVSTQAWWGVFLVLVGLPVIAISVRRTTTVLA